MISVIHNHGTSFKGLMAYLMHDPDYATTSDRVAWTETYNLATDDPELGWKTMAATALSQADLKAEAGIKNTGRKSNKHVMHYTLSWHDEERKELTRDEMIQAALASMTYIGTSEGEKTGKKNTAKRTQYADEHQAVIVCHDEAEKSPHVHIMLNRVNPRTGVFLPDSMDYNKLSAWALDYRKGQGKEHYCPQRQINAAKKAQGLKTSHRRKSRTAYEAEQTHEQADPDSRKKAFLELQRKRAGELMAKKAEMKKQHADATHKLEDEHLQAERAGRSLTAERIRDEKSRIRAGFAPKIDALTEQQQQEIKVFNEAKNTARGRVRNAWAALKTKQWMTEIRTRPLHATTNAFKLAFDSGLQQRDIEKHHTKETQDLTAERRKTERKSAREARTQEQIQLKDRRQDYETSRNALIFKQDMERAKLKAEWHQLQQNRQAIATEDERSRKAKTSPTGDAMGSASGGRSENKKQAQDMKLDKSFGDETQHIPADISDVPEDSIHFGRDLKALRDLNRQAGQRHISGRDGHEKDGKDHD